MEVDGSLPSLLSMIFSSTKSSQTSSCITDCSTTLIQDFYYRNEVLARNSTGKLSTPAAADQQNTRVAYKLSEEILSCLATLLALLLSSNGGTRLLPSPLSTMFFFNKDTNIFSYITDNPVTLMQDFYCRNEVLTRNSTGKLTAPAGAVQQHTKVPYRLSEEISSWLRTLLVLLLISNLDAHLTTESTLIVIFFFCKANCLITLMHLLPGQLEAAIYLIKQTAFSPLTRNNTKNSTHRMSPKLPAQLSYGLIT